MEVAKKRLANLEEVEVPLKKLLLLCSEVITNE
jgi:hypothetical protein